MLLLENLALGFAKRKIFATLWKTHGLVFDTVFSLGNGGENESNQQQSKSHSLYCNDK